MEIRRLGPSDGDIVIALATREPHTALLEDERTVFVVAFEHEHPIGFAFGYVLARRHGRPASLFVYEVEVDERYRRGGVGAALMRKLAQEAAVDEGFVLTEPDNEAANALYRSLGGTAVETVQWDFDYTAG
jgi:ribosomal protein S18 acetylase RimI-like enzyme